MDCLLGLKGISSILMVLDIFKELSETKEYRLLSGKGFNKEYHSPNFHRLNIVYDYIINYFREEICLKEVVNAANMSQTAFCRFLKKEPLKHLLKLCLECA